MTTVTGKQIPYVTIPLAHSNTIKITENSVEVRTARVFMRSLQRGDEKHCSQLLEDTIFSEVFDTIIAPPSLYCPLLVFSKDSRQFLGGARFIQQEPCATDAELVFLWDQNSQGASFERSEAIRSLVWEYSSALKGITQIKALVAPDDLTTITLLEKEGLQASHTVDMAGVQKTCCTTGPEFAEQRAAQDIASLYAEQILASAL